MSELLLDSNVCIAILNGRPASVSRFLADVLDDGHWPRISTVVIHELWYGVHRSERRERNATMLRQFLGRGFPIEPLEVRDAEIAGNLRAELAALGKPIGPYDTLIAAQAIRLDAVLVTANTREFSRVPGLRWLDWSTEPPLSG